MQPGDIRFLLSLQIIADEMIPRFDNAKFYQGDDAPVLEDWIWYTSDEMSDHTDLEEGILYLTDADTLLLLPLPRHHVSLILIGNPPPAWVRARHSIFSLPEGTSPEQAVSACSAAFRKNRRWSDKLLSIYASEGGVDDLCRASYDYFSNPLFVHDAQLYLISCPVWKPGMIEWEEDDKTGLLYTPAEAINEFNTDAEYLRTLETEGAQYYSSSLRGYRDIYVNIRSHSGRYEGRLVIAELESSFKPGQMLAAEYLAGLIRMILLRDSHFERSFYQELDQLLSHMIMGESIPAEKISTRIEKYGWRLNDQFICVRLNEETAGQAGISPVISTCSYIESSIEKCKAFFMKGSFYIVINVSQNPRYRQQLAEVIRDFLYKAGISNPFHNLMLLAEHAGQAEIALKYCLKFNDSRWYISFSDIALDYILDTACPKQDLRYVSAPELFELMAFDRVNQSELFNTLQVYLNNDRNTVKSARDLYIGRSTLFYRLRKIQEITGLDAERLSNPDLNLYLRLSFYLLKRMNTRRGD